MALLLLLVSLCAGLDLGFSLTFGLEMGIDCVDICYLFALVYLILIDHRRHHAYLGSPQEESVPCQVLSLLVHLVLYASSALLAVL